MERLAVDHRPLTRVSPTSPRTLSGRVRSGPCSGIWLLVGIALTSIGTGVNPAGDARDTSPNILAGDVNGNIPPPILLRTFGYSRPILVALRSLSLKPISFGYKTPPIRFSQADGQSAHKARPPNLELALTPLSIGDVAVGDITLMTFAVFDLSSLTAWTNCSFYIYRSNYRESRCV